MQWTDYVPGGPEGSVWDVVVVGTGAGGAAAVFNLARLGHSVLFLERGKVFDETGAMVRNSSLAHSQGTIYSDYPPYTAPSRDPDNDGGPVLSLGHGIGGTTSLYSMVLDRFRPIDLVPGRFSRVAPLATLPEAWPIPYEDLEPYYQEAEVLFRVRGTL